jgi:ATP-dependent RNA helicase RhlE
LPFAVVWVGNCDHVGQLCLDDTAKYISYMSSSFSSRPQSKSGSSNSSKSSGSSKPRSQGGSKPRYAKKSTSGSTGGSRPRYSNRSRHGSSGVSVLEAHANGKSENGERESRSGSTAPIKSAGPSGFDRFGLHPLLIRGVQGAGFVSPRDIQTETIPAGLEGRDILGLAQTGTGKTAAFALPLLDRLLDDRRKGPRAIVLAPTRELANQIAEEIRLLSKFTKLKLVTIYGGASMRSQISHLRNRPEIVVGCPGRVLDLLRQGILRLDQVETLVLDEADHMFDMGFLPDIRKILGALPAKRQNLLFSATMPDEIRLLADDLLSNPHVVELADSAPASTIDHSLYPVDEGRKRDLLEHVLTDDSCTTAIVFTRTKHRARRLAEQLTNAGHRAVGLQGNMSQAQRDKAMRGFRTRQFDVLVATDIAARGIDVSGVSHVINFDVPNTPQAYTHRIGRTGRSETDGVAYTFVTHSDRAWVRATERMIGSPIKRHQVAGFEPAVAERSDMRRPPRNYSRGARTGGGQTGRPGGRPGGYSGGRPGGRSGGSGNGRSSSTGGRSGRSR